MQTVSLPRRAALGLVSALMLAAATQAQAAKTSGAAAQPLQIERHVQGALVFALLARAGVFGLMGSRPLPRIDSPHDAALGTCTNCTYV